MIVDFAVEDDPNCAVFIAERLMATGDINDAQAAHSNCGRPVGVNAFIVGAAMGHGGAHSSHHTGIGARVVPKLHHTSDATHGRVSSVNCFLRVPQFDYAALPGRKT